MKNPRRNIYRGVLYLVLIVLVFYLLLQLIFMVALKPRTRGFGAVVFVVVGLLIGTVSLYDLLVTIMVLCGLILVFLGSQGIAKLKMNLFFSVPFLIYIWSVYFFHLYIAIGVISLVFFIIVTDKRFVSWAQSYRQKSIKESNKLEVLESRDHSKKAKLIMV